MMPESYRTAANGRQYNVCRSGFLPRQSRLLHPSAPTASPHQAQPLQFLSASGEPELSPQVRTMLEDEDGLSERGLSSSRRRYDDEEDYHSIYIGVPVPRGYRRKRRRRRSASSRDRTSESERHYERQERSDTDDGGHGCYESGNDNASRTMSPAAERLRYILGDDDEPPNPTLFTEMDTLQHDGEEMEWKESARWIKFEEKVEEGGERWSKPHVSTLSLHSLFELRTCLQTGTVLLDLDGYSLPQIIDDVIEKQIEDGLLKPELREKISYVLLRKHRHQTKKPIHRSLADIGKSVSSNTSRSPVRSPAAGAAFHRSTEDLRMRQSASYGRLRHVQSRSMNDISDTPSTDQLKNKFIKKIPKDAEASNVLVGEVEFLEKPFVAFVRLLQATMLGGVTEVPVPTRFLFILLGPAGKAKSYNEIGRAIATLMVDDLFSDVAYKARDREDLIAGIDEFLDEVIVLPPGEWDPNIRIEPPKKVPSAEKRKSVFSLNEVGQMNGTAGGAGAGSGGGGSDDGEMPEVHEIGEELAWTGRFCGGLYLDIKRKLPWFPSDFYEGFHIQSISAILFIYLGCITNAITFGGLLGDATDNYQGVMESFLGTAMAGSMFCLFAGQPLIILSSTGPILIFEKLLFDFSKGNGIDYMEFRLWIGLHSALQCLILVATDASFIIKYITRFTEEGFSTLISFIFIYDAIKKMIGAFKYYPINSDFKPDYVTMYKCECVAPDPANMTLFDASVPVAPNTTNVSLYNAINLTALDWTQLSKKECLKYGGSLVGKSCKFVPDLALMSFILFFGTYSMTLTLKKFKFSRYFPTKLSDAAWALVCWISQCHAMQKGEKCFLLGPSLLTFPMSSPSCCFVVWMPVSAWIPRSCTSPVSSSPRVWTEGGLSFPLGRTHGGCTWPARCLPCSSPSSSSWTSRSQPSSSTGRSTSCGEQRVTGIIVFVLTGISVFLAPILKHLSPSPGVSCCLPWGKGRVFPCPQYIPMPVLYGVFLYMGVASLNGIQFWDRCKLFLMPAKHQPDYVFLRHVPLRRIHLFTLVQIVCLAVLWILKSTVAAIIFPVMILALILVRRLLDFVFSQHDLAWIDNIIPEKEKKKEDDKKKKKKGNKGDSSSDEEERGPPPGALRSDSSPNGSDMDRSITLHLKISCPSSPAFNYSRSPICAVPQVKIEMESDYEDTDTEKAPRDMGSETTL
ncbi:electrogenic sodium bicarbonate cotransporter 4 isoform X7 [Tympanuchus pallidicinctus]|uniref:electrogenic sodium bicarbonate cotransporter 4 isoform X7 n=1 Tax=Tympanuchus pallidicinctus TaxID=109042 RepID=UPI002286D129|nr:electrogenic sodium bicarbonate cotransporter 4 isoform X7 [Tympanuchus pallidicinctus]